MIKKHSKQVRILLYITIIIMESIKRICQKFQELSKQDKYQEALMLFGENENPEKCFNYLISCYNCKNKNLKLLTIKDIHFFENQGVNMNNKYDLLFHCVYESNIDLIQYLLENYKFDVDKSQEIIGQNKVSEDICKLFIDNEVLIEEDFSGLIISTYRNEELFSQLITLAKKKRLFTENIILDILFNKYIIKKTLFRLKDYIPKINVNSIIEYIEDSDDNIGYDGLDNIMECLIIMLEQNYISIKEIIFVFQESIIKKSNKMSSALKFLMNLKKHGISIDELLEE